MKKIFTLIATAMVALAANAIEYEVGGDEIAVGTALVDNSLVKITTANNAQTPTMMVNEEGETEQQTYAGETFCFYLGVRVENAPSADSPTGTAHDTNVALVLEAKQNVDVTLYYKVGSTKSIDCYDQTVKEAVAIAQTATNPGADYLYCTGVYKLQAGHTYTVWTRGGTVQLHGINTAEGTYTEPTSKMYGYNDATNEVTYNDGAKMQITGNTTKKFASATSIKGISSIKNSNGAQMTLTAPEGKYAKSVTFYFAANKDDEEGKLTEINGETISGVSAVGKIHSDPTVYKYEFATQVPSFTFTFTSKQVNFVVEVEYATGDPTAVAAVNAEQAAKAPVKVLTAKGIQIGNYNIAGQKVK